MYNNFFGFKERPFQLVPNPEYLYLSRSHEEAIAHLRYALSDGDGFVELTGEVGTGKTTLCRAFLETLGTETEVAYIFNPRLDSIELLRAINDEFGIDSVAHNAKDLIDALNVFLMEEKGRNKSAVLLIDEAQNLSKEVLEQLRLLSNLETNTSKLLQIILVGQPELSKMLDAYALRQLRQRITLSWYLSPLNGKETRGYIRHRVGIAARKDAEVFSEGAYRLIHKYAGGIPRLINIACDRALLTAYGLNSHKVTTAVASAAIKELKERGGAGVSSFSFPKWLPWGVAGLSVAALVVLFIVGPFWFRGSTPDAPRTVAAVPVETGIPGGTSTPSSPAVPAGDASVPAPQTTAPAGAGQKTPKSEGKLNALLAELDGTASRFGAAGAAMGLWGVTPVLNPHLNSMDNDTAFFQLAATQNNFQLLTLQKDWRLVTRLNLPTILELYPPNVLSPRYLTLVEIKGDQIVLKDGGSGKRITIPARELQDYWAGTVHIPWRNFMNCDGDIPENAPKESIITLKMLLRDIGFSHLDVGPLYDEATAAAVKQVQERNGLKVDGIVGSRTKIVIYNAKPELTIPHLRSTSQ